MALTSNTTLMRAVNGRRAAIAGGYDRLTRVIGRSFLPLVVSLASLFTLSAPGFTCWPGFQNDSWPYSTTLSSHGPVIGQMLFPPIDPAIANVLPVFYSAVDIMMTAVK